jgi:iturin family lipopeptide synthetase A
MNLYLLAYRVRQAIKQRLQRHLWARRSRPPQYTQQQRQYLEALVERIHAKTPGSLRRCREGKDFLVDPLSINFVDSTSEAPLRATSYPLISQRAEGAHLWDIDGNRYLDFVMGYGVHLFGFSPDIFQTAMREAAESGSPIGPLSQHAHEAAERLTRLTGVERVAFCNTGTEAVMYATRLARAATGRKNVVVFADSYHGTCAEAVYATLWATGAPPSVRWDLIVMDYNCTESLRWLDRFGDQVAGVIVEPVRSRYPGERTESFLKELRAITARHGAALIFDEVLLGFRIAPGGAQSWFGIQADLVTYGKLLGGGLPIGAVGGTRDFMFSTGGTAAGGILFRGTFNRNPITMASTAALLRKLEQEGPRLQEGLNQTTTRLVERLRTQFEVDGVSLEIAQFGSLFLFQHRLGPEFFRAHMLDKGIHSSPVGMFFLSTAHTQEDLDFLFEAVTSSARDMQALELL